jgi:hypothetical protein
MIVATGRSISSMPANGVPPQGETLPPVPIRRRPIAQHTETKPKSPWPHSASDRLAAGSDTASEAAPTDS